MAQREPQPEPARTVRIDLPVDADEDVATLRGALLAARATALAEIHRRGFRHFAGYGSDSAREGMTEEVRHQARRLELLDRLIAALPKTE
jgi:hypothetical protein